MKSSGLNRVLNEMLCPDKRKTAWSYTVDGGIKFFQHVYGFYFMLEDVIDREFKRVYLDRIVSPERNMLLAKVSIFNAADKVLTKEGQEG